MTEILQLASMPHTHTMIDIHCNAYWSVSGDYTNASITQALAYSEDIQCRVGPSNARQQCPLWRYPAWTSQWRNSMESLHRKTATAENFLGERKLGHVQVLCCL